MKTFKQIYQTDSKDCAPACLKMVAQHYGKHVSRQYLREVCHISRQGTTMLSLAFIIGQVAAPIGSFIGFAQNYQDAKISLERLNDLYTHKDEEQSMQDILEI